MCVCSYSVDRSVLTLMNVTVVMMEVKVSVAKSVYSASLYY